jgi:mono/diheme cytochrome c family protein
MKKIITIIPLAAITFFFVQSCGTDETKTNNDSAGSATVAPSTNGRVLFEEKCTVCHGSDGKQNTMGAADLSTSKLNHETVVTIIKSGKNGMKAFSPELNDEQIEAVAAYVESLRK